MQGVIGFSRIYGAGYTASGVFEKQYGDAGQDKYTWGQEAGDLSAKIEFAASRSSIIYSGTTMQPKALNCLPCIRY